MFTCGFDILNKQSIKGIRTRNLRTNVPMYYVYVLQKQAIFFFFDTGLFSCGVNRYGARFSEDWTGIFNIFFLPRRNIIALLVKAKSFIFEIQKNNIMESLYFYWNLWILIICAIEGLNFLEGLRTKLPTSLLQCM